MGYFSGVLKDAKLCRYLDGEARDAVASVLRAHPDASRKMGRGAPRGFQVRQDPEKGYRYFVVIREDGTAEDFSVRKGVDTLFPGFANVKRKGNQTRRERPGADGNDVNAAANAANFSSPSSAVDVAVNAARLNRVITDCVSVDELLELLATDRGALARFDHIHVPTAFVTLNRLAAAAPMGDASGAFYVTLVPIRPRSRGERRSLRTFAGVSLRPGSIAFNPDTPRRLSTPTDAFQLHPDVRSYGPSTLRRSRSSLCAATLEASRRRRSCDRSRIAWRRRNATPPRRSSRA
jgi:hypothetical protein